MGAEIKVKQEEIEQALTTLKSSTNALQTSIPSNIDGNNVLDVVNKLNRLNQTMQQVTEAYKSLLLQNEEATRRSVEFMVETDQQLSSNIKLK
ncbi:YwqI/YxiC family protein [Peribacillus sp. NPDC096540]|uniref:YwqI/YxiC family protein n=1 Tax=Peribacillus sp. NPDC096540 TaxID=3390612 RepID=UPI003CFF7A29